MSSSCAKDEARRKVSYTIVLVLVLAAAAQHSCCSRGGIFHITDERRIHTLTTVCTYIGAQTAGESGDGRGDREGGLGLGIV